jgi:WD40 repeat protein
MTFFEQISVSTMHVYCSALLFTPQETLLYRTFEKELRGGVMIQGNVEKKWNVCLRATKGPTLIRSVTFSPNGDHIAYGSMDGTVTALDSATGAMSQRSRGTRVVLPVSCSPQTTAISFLHLGVLAPYGGGTPSPERLLQRSN